MPQSVITFLPRESEKIRSHRKERSFWKQLSLIDLNTGREALCVRWYGAGEVSYCCVWANRQNARGAGKAGGGGYHKASASFAYAMSDAGFTLAEDIDGRGDSAIDGALDAIAAAFEIKRHMIVRAHA
jgi:hypothetical protein